MLLSVALVVKPVPDCKTMGRLKVRFRMRNVTDEFAAELPMVTVPVVPNALAFPMMAVPPLSRADAIVLLP